MPRRRKSTRLSTAGEVLLSHNDDQEERERNQQRRRQSKGRKSLGLVQEHRRRSSGLQDGFTDELFTHCMQLLTKNKINQKNTWDLDLIDHAGKVLRLDKVSGRDTDFQKASCTLDASVKIYGYRVESVHKQTFRVWGDLASGFNTGEQTALEDEDERENDGDDASSGAKARARRKVARGVRTLETNLNNLNAKDDELLSATDDSFRRTAAAFDEGGARGLLLNNISLRSGCELAFDTEAQDVLIELQRVSTNFRPLLEEDEEEDEEANEDAQEDETNTANSLIEDDEGTLQADHDDVAERPDDGEEMIDQTADEDAMQDSEDQPAESRTKSALSQVKAEEEQVVAGEPAAAEEEEPDHEVDMTPFVEQLRSSDIEKLEVCPTFARFHFGGEGSSLADFAAITNDDDLLIGDAESDDEEDTQEGFQMPNQYDDAEVEFNDYDGGDQFDIDDDDAIDNLLLDEFVPVSAGSEAAPSLSGVQQYVDALVPDPNGVELAVVMASDPNDEYSYFDINKLSMLQKNWAGPAHWRFTRRTARAPSEATSSGKATNGKRARRKAFHIDFESDPIDADQAFATSRASTVLTKGQLDRAAQKALLLPEDKRYEVKRLLRLFSKPQWRIRRSSRTAIDAENTESAMTRFEFVGPVEDHPECLEAPAVAEDEDAMDFDIGADHSFSDPFDSMPDDEISPSATGHSCNTYGSDLLTGIDLVDEPDKVGDIQINYARKAKQVDVKALKASIWSELCEEQPDPENEEPNRPQKVRPHGFLLKSDHSLMSSWTRADELIDLILILHADELIDPILILLLFAFQKVKPAEKDTMLGDGRDFQEMLEKLPARVDSKQREQISVPFCFICLLHLCNEKNLELSQQPGDLTSLFVRPGDS